MNNCRSPLPRTKRCVILCGPTAGGKTALSLLLAERFHATVISADSMQIYRGMNIGTAKPTEEEQRGIPHRLLDVCSPGTPFSVVEYQRRAKEAMNEAVADGRLPILTGGTGLYIDSILYNLQYAEVPEDEATRRSLEQEYDSIGGNAMLHQLQTIDPLQASKLSSGDRKRIVRALEVYRLSGKTLSEYNEASRKVPSDFQFLTFVLCYRDRQNLYDRINRRVDQMIKDGLLEEAKELIANGVAETPTASQAIGYKELFGYLRGQATLEESIELLKQRSRNYAKRQITWFKKYDAIPIYMDASPDFAQIENQVADFINEGS